MWARVMSGIRFTGERERNISRAFALAASEWAERAHTQSGMLNRSAHMLWLHLVLLDLITHIYI